MGRLKTVRFYTLGCKVNQYETQAIREQFQQASFEEIQNSQPAGVCVINTCTVTHRADSSSFYLIRRAVCENPDAQIIVTGCLTQFDSDRIARIPGVSLIVKNEDKNRIISLLDNQLATCYSLLVPPLHAGAGLATQSGITYFKNHSRAFLKIQDGCDYRCSYCKVRLVRGKSRSRTSSEIKEELAALVKKDYREIVLCGICLGSYGKDLIPQLSLTKLIGELETIDAAFRIRLSSIEAKDVTDELIHIMSDSDRLCRHLHIPVQSGDERILKMMNRQYSRDDYIKLIKHLKDCIPEIAITTDVMVGFPGETSEGFGNTVELIKQIQPMRLHIFPYSRRKGTPAYNLGESVSESEIKSRMEYLREISRKARFTYCKRFISRIADVLVERPVQGSPNLLYRKPSICCSDTTGGLLRGVQAPHLKGDSERAEGEGAPEGRSPYGQDSARVPPLHARAGRAKRVPILWEGYTDTYIKVRIESNLDLENKIVKAKLRKIYKDFVLADIA